VMLPLKSLLSKIVVVHHPILTLPNKTLCICELCPSVDLRQKLDML